jgi:cytochrome c oxidase subunit 2
MQHAQPAVRHCAIDVGREAHTWHASCGIIPDMALIVDQEKEAAASPRPASPLVTGLATRAGLVLALLAGTLAAARGTAMPPPDAGADGRGLYAACAACHGEHGQGDAKNGAPNIAGLDAAYIERQLRNFAAGRRGADARDPYGPRMRAAAQALAGASVPRALAEFVAGLPARPVAGAPEGQRDKGRNYFNAVCSACHNSNGLGSPALSAPRLAGTDPRYLLRQLAAFRSGTRGADPADTYGGQMRRMVLTLPGPQTDRDIVAYLATLPAGGAAGGAP